MRISLLFSILLHAGLIAFVMYVPLRPPVDLTRPVYQVSLVMGAPGGEKLPSPVLGHRPPETAKPTPSVEAPKPEAVPAPAPEAVKVPEVPKPDVVAPKPEPAPEPKPEPKPEPLPEKKPDPVQVPKAPEPKPEEKKAPEPEKKPEPKPEPKPEKKPEPKPEKKPEPKKEEKKAKPKPKPKKNDVLADALADARKQANSGRSGSSSASRALRDLEKQVARQGVGGGGGEGDGPGGGGIYDVYVAQVILAVQPNWSMPTYSRTNMVVQVRIQLDRSGRVLDCKIVNSSGRPEFDASAVNAVLRTGTLPPPPTPAQQELIISFNSLQMLGK